MLRTCARQGQRQARSRADPYRSPHRRQRVSSGQQQAAQVCSLGLQSRINGAVHDARERCGCDGSAAPGVIELLDFDGSGSDFSGMVHGVSASTLLGKLHGGLWHVACYACAYLLIEET